MQNNKKEQSMSYAGFWVRLAAYLIDSVIVGLGLLIVRAVLLGVMSVLEETPLSGNILFTYTLKDIILYLAQVLYFIMLTYTTGSTVGKRAMNLRVVYKDGQTELKLLDVIYRETIGRFLCKILVGIGYLFVGFDPKKRGLHDMLCDTQVIYAKSVKVYKKVQTVPVYVPQMPGEGYQMNDGVQMSPDEQMIYNPVNTPTEDCRLNSSYNGYQLHKEPEIVNDNCHLQKENEVPGGYHLTDDSKVDIVDEENIQENDL